MKLWFIITAYIVGILAVASFWGVIFYCAWHFIKRLDLAGPW